MSAPGLDVDVARVEGIAAALDAAAAPLAGAADGAIDVPQAGPVTDAVVGFVAFRSTSRQYLAAGADWLQAGRTAWVDVYALTTVTVAAGTGQHWITLADRGERHATISTNDLHANPALWDLVYNGIRHSSVDGARITGSGAHNLGPPGPDDR